MQLPTGRVGPTGRHCPKRLQALPGAAAAGFKGPSTAQRSTRLAVEAVDLVHAARLMVAPREVHVVGVEALKGHEGEDDLQAEGAAVHKVAWGTREVGLGWVGEGPCVWAGGGWRAWGWVGGGHWMGGLGGWGVGNMR